MKLINKYPSDLLRDSDSLKVSNLQNLGFLYDMFISCLIQYNNKPIRILELGVSHWHYGSIHCMENENFVSEYVGIDIQDLKLNLISKGKFIKADTDSQQCLNILDQYDPFNLIIHDANHITDSQIYFFENYYRFLDVPGIMVCEDIVDPNAILDFLNDNDLHLFYSPPLNGRWSKSLVKMKFKNKQDFDQRINTVLPY